MASSAKYYHPEVLSRITRLELRARTVMEGFVSGLHQSPYQGHSVEFAQHREYAAGDDLRHLDWRMLARSDRLYIKQYEEETNLRCHILVDGSASMSYPAEGSSWTKWDYAATLAACLAHLQIHQQDAAGLVLFDAAIRQQLPPAASSRQLAHIMQVLENHTPAAGTDVTAVFGQLAEQARRRGLIVLISDLLADLPSIIDSLARLSALKQEIIVFHLLHSDELNFPFEQRTLFEGLELPQRLKSDPQALRRAYLAAVQGFIGRVRGFCMDHRMDYRQLNTSEPLDVALTSYLAWRCHGRSK
ncbi:MAG: hypothetical protein HJJLKODD_01038 [Phycisphaerae bacterium]|nr:hypothetical protein [Phycisphaerae bacterium]